MNTDHIKELSGQTQELKATALQGLETLKKSIPNMGRDYGKTFTRLCTELELALKTGNEALANKIKKELEGMK